MTRRRLAVGFSVRFKSTSHDWSVVKDESVSGRLPVITLKTRRRDVIVLTELLKDLFHSYKTRMFVKMSD